MAVETLDTWAKRELGGTAGDLARRAGATECDGWSYTVYRSKVRIDGVVPGERNMAVVSIVVADLPPEWHVVEILQLDGTTVQVVTDDPDNEEFSKLLKLYTASVALLQFLERGSKATGWMKEDQLIDFRVQSAIFDSTREMELTLVSFASAGVKVYEDAVQAFRNFVADHPFDPPS